MNKKIISKDRLINILLALTASLISIYAIELVLRISPLSDRLACNRTLPFSRRVAKFNLKAKIRIVCLGDSFTVWRAGEGLNMLDYLQEGLFNKGCAILNLGAAGENIDQYIAIYNRYVQFKPECIIMCIYLGNDIRNYPPFAVIDRMPVNQTDGWGGWRPYLKRHSILANLIFRFGKEHVSSMRSGFFERNMISIQKELGVSGDFVQSRIEQADPQILKLAKSDAIDPYIVAGGIVNPDGFKYGYALSSQNANMIIDKTIDVIEKFHRKQGVKDFFVVLLPESVQVSEKYDYFFKKCGFNLDNLPLQERRKKTQYIETRLNELGIKTLDCTSALEKEDDVYIKFDIHLNKRGQKIVGQLMTDYIKNNILYIQ